MSRAAFAARQGVGASALSNWFARGKLTEACLTQDGKIIVAEAERQLGATLNIVRSEGARAVVAERAGGPVGAAEISTREQILQVELEQRRRRLEVEKGVYVRADQVRAERGRALAQMIAAIDSWIPELAADLALDREALARVRASWRHFRERQADALLAEAEQLPELLHDAA